jgi:hypothetical protein
VAHATLSTLPVDTAHVPLQWLVLPLDDCHAGWRACVFATR